MLVSNGTRTHMPHACRDARLRLLLLATCGGVAMGVGVVQGPEVETKHANGGHANLPTTVHVCVCVLVCACLCVRVCVCIGRE